MQRDVVIIGGGIVGSSIAWNLVTNGCRGVLVIEREKHQGLGSTGKSMGGVRAQFATAPNIALSLYSIPFYGRFDEETGHPSGYRDHGYLFVASSRAHLEFLRANVARQRALGLDAVQLLQPEEVLRLVPLLRGDDVTGGSFCGTDGFVDPWSVMNGYTAAAVARGAEVWRGVEVTGVRVTSGRIAGVDTTRGPVDTPVVVNAGGPWAASIARLAGLDLPVQPLRRMLVPTEPFPGLPERLPMVIDMATGFHFRPEGLGLLLAWNDPEEQPGEQDGFDPAFVEKILARAVTRVPAFADLAVNPRRGWAGLYEMSPDHQAILGPAPGIEGLFLANGFSGHGVMHAPATGRIIADLITRGACDALPWQSFAFERFARGELLHEPVL